MPDVGVVIAAGGRGRRMGALRPKQFLKIGRLSILQMTVAVFESHPLIREIVVVVPRRYVRSTQRSLGRRGRAKVSAVVAGGSDRQQSVRAGLGAFRRAPGIVLVHDAVRPLIDQGSITGVIQAVQRYGAAVLATPVHDTLKLEVRRGFAARTLPREHVWAVQTPQGFLFNLLLKAHAAAAASGFVGTDEASLVERLGKAVRLVRGTDRNVKITTRQDLNLVRILASDRVGRGRSGR